MWCSKPRRTHPCRSPRRDPFSAPTQLAYRIRVLIGLRCPLQRGGPMSRLSKLNRSIAGEVAIVTGAASGMGRATAQLFADEGAKVAAIDINEAPLKSVVGEIEGAGGTVRGWTLDLSDRKAIDRVIGEVAAHFGGIDILVNNAGISIPIAIDNENYEAAWQKSLDVLITAHTRTIRAALPHLRKSKAPRIVNI